MKGCGDMAEQDNREPIEARHVTFAQALVALAREHGVKNVTADFYGGGIGDTQRWTKIHLAWSEGRHGDRSRISLRAEAIHHCPETAHDRP